MTDSLLPIPEPATGIWSCETGAQIAPGRWVYENAWDRYATSQQHAGPEKGDCG